MNDLLLATARGNRNALVKFWKNNGEPNAETLDLTTLQNKSLELLSQTSFDVNALFGGYTALHIAAHKGYKEVVELLLQKGANIEAKNKKEFTALYIAAAKGHKEIVKLLLQKRPKIEPQGSELFTPLQRAAEKGHKEIVELLIKAGADIEDQVLHIAAENGQKEIVELLIKEGADIKAEDSEGFTALHEAARNSHKEVVELLLQKGADIDTQSSDTGFTALHFAAFEHDKEMVELLLQKGADIEAEDFNGKTALDIAAQCGDKETIDLLIECKKDINTKDNYENTVLHVAAQFCDKKTVELLLQKGANIEAKNFNGKTALDIAAQRGCKKIVELLLPKGAKIESQDIYGRNALHVAARNGHTEVLEYLISIGVDVGAKDEAGNTAMKTVILYGHKKIKVVSLLSHYKKLLDLKESIISDYISTNIDKIIKCELRPNNTLQGLHNILESFSNAGDNDFCKGFINKIKSTIVKVINKDVQIDLTNEENVQKFNEDLSKTKNIQKLLEIRPKIANIANFKKLLSPIKAKPTDEDMLVNNYIADLYKTIKPYKKICQAYDIVNEKIASFARPTNIPTNPFSIGVSYMDSDSLLNLFKAKYCLKAGELIQNQNMAVSHESMAKRQKLTDITNQASSLNLSESESVFPIDGDKAEVEITGNIEE